jgi:excinuclease ABC subunit C
LEANLIKKYQPKFNVVWRDDKNYFYVAIEQNDQKIPFVYITHQKNQPKTEYIGPFVEGTALKKTLRFLRRVFPYYTIKKHPKIKCTWCHLGLCPGPEPDLTEYKKNIKKLMLILKGKRSSVLNLLKREMKQLSKDRKFEEAAKIRDRIYNLQQIMAHTHVISGNFAENSNQVKNSNNLKWEKTEKMLNSLIGQQPIKKIECYDISNIQGKQATGSMVCFEYGKPNKNLYRKFRIRSLQTPNDIAMLKEVLARRFAHSEWEYPDVILIDGGKAQLNVAISEKNQKTETKKIKVISIAKGRQELFIEGKNLPAGEPIPLKDLPQEIYNLILHLDDEAHRFAITYHKNLRKKNLFK